MITIPSQEIKRRGISAVDDVIGFGPAHVIKNNRPQYVILREEDFATLMQDLEDARLALSEAEWRSGRVRKGTAEDLLAEVLTDGE